MNNPDKYNYGFRQLDPQICRWHVVDAMAERYLSTSPYAYVENNPISFTDYMGLWKFPVYFEGDLLGYVSGEGNSWDWVSSGGGSGEGSNNEGSESYSKYKLTHPRRIGDISWRKDKILYFFRWLIHNWSIDKGTEFSNVSDNNPYELPEKNGNDMFGVYGLDWGIETDNNVLQNSAPTGINKDGAIRYYYCGSCIFDPGNGIAERGRYLYQKPVYIRSQVYGHQVPGGINIDTGANSFAITSVGFSMGHFAHNNSFSLSDFDLSLSNTLFEAQIDITINPNIPGVENINSVKEFIKQRWNGTNVNIIYDNTLELYYYNVQISAGKW